MRIRFPFAYKANVRTVRGVVGEIVTGAWGEAEIPEATSAEAPVVVAYRIATEDYDREVRKTNGGFYRQLRATQNGDLFQSHVSARDLAFAHPLRKSFFAEERNRGYPHHVLEGLGHPADPYVHLEHLAENQHLLLAGQEIISSEMEATQEMHRAAAEKLLVVDGMVWESCPEPHLSVHRKVDFRREVVFPDRFEHKVLAAEAIFRMDQFDVSERLLDALRHYHKTVKEPFKVAPDGIESVDVIMPGALRVRAEETFAAEAAEYALKALKADRLSWMSSDFILAWVRLRDAARMADGEGKLDAIVDAHAEFVSTARRELSGGHLHHHDKFEAKTGSWPNLIASEFEFEAIRRAPTPEPDAARLGIR